MARIKGKWVGQVVVEFDSESGIPVDSLSEQIMSGAKEELSRLFKRQFENAADDLFAMDDKWTVTVTQLHADLYRDEPREWTKEEATP